MLLVNLRCYSSAEVLIDHLQISLTVLEESSVRKWTLSDVDGRFKNNIEIKWSDI
jgi:hypothetical protein